MILGVAIASGGAGRAIALYLPLSKTSKVILSRGERSPKIHGVSLAQSSCWSLLPPVLSNKTE